MINQEGGGKEYCRQYLVDGLSWPFKHAFEPTQVCFITDYAKYLHEVPGTHIIQVKILLLVTEKFDQDQVSGLHQFGSMDSDPY